MHLNAGGGGGGFIATRDDERYARQYPALLATGVPRRWRDDHFKEFVADFTDSGTTVAQINESLRARGRGHRRAHHGADRGDRAMSMDLRHYHVAVWDEPLIMEQGALGRRGTVVPAPIERVDLATLLPSVMRRATPPALLRSGEPKNGGPAVGAYGCAAELECLLPGPLVVATEAGYERRENPTGVGRVREYLGNLPQVVKLVVKAYSWLTAMGGDGRRWSAGSRRHLGAGEQLHGDAPPRRTRSWRDALRADRALATGLNTYDGCVTNAAVAEAEG